MILTEAQAEADVGCVVPVDTLDAGSQTFDYLRLSDAQFELLLYSLARSSAPESIDRTWSSAAIMVRGADAGRDVLLSNEGRAVGVVQCKRLESSMPLPAVFREIAKLVLFAKVGEDLNLADGLTYLLAVARDPSRTVVDYFARRQEVEAANRDAIRAAAREVRDSYTTLEHLTDDEAESAVVNALPRLKPHLLRPADLDEWLGREAGVSRRFFRQRLVVDNEPLQKGFADVMAELARISGRVANIEPITDEDLAILREDIADTPETHRLNVGMGMLFGFPREMFVGREALSSRIGRLNELLIEVARDQTDWTFAEARRLADEVLSLADASGISPFAVQLPGPFLGLVAKECLATAASGSVMEDIVAKLSGEKKHESDDERLDEVRRLLEASGLRYLAGDFSEIVGDAEEVALKREIISHLLRDITQPEQVGAALDQGLALLRPHLIVAADELRRLCKHRTTIVLTGSRGIDSEASLKRFADTVRALEKHAVSGPTTR